jgi:hypothetical protein
VHHCAPAQAAPELKHGAYSELAYEHLCGHGDALGEGGEGEFAAQPPDKPSRQPISQSRLTTYGVAAVSLFVLALITPTFAGSWTMSLLMIAP